MAGSFGFVSNIAVAAGAGVGGITTLSAGGSRYDCFVAVAQCCDLLGLSFAAGAGAGLFACLGAGRSLGFAPLAPGMASSRNDFLCNDDLATNGAMLALGQTGFGTGGGDSFVNDLGVPQSVSNSLSHDHGAAVTAVGAFGQAGGGAGCCHGGIGDDIGVLTNFRRCLPYTVGVGVSVGSTLHISAIAILQHGGNDGDFNVGNSFTRLRCLVGDSFRACCYFNHTASGAVNVGTAGGGVQRACSCVHCAVDLNQGIHQVAFLAGIGSAGRILQRSEFRGIAAAEACPDIAVIDIHSYAGCQGHAGLFIDVNLSAGDQSEILVDRHSTVNELNGNIAVQLQNIISRIQIRSAHVQSEGGEGAISAYFHDQAVRGTVVLLRYRCAAFGHTEQTGASDKLCCGRELSAGHVNRSENVFLRAVVQGEGDLNVLDIILGQRENFIFHTGGHRAAAEIGDLEVFINHSAAVCGNGAGAGNVAVGIQSAAVIDGDGAASLHVDEAHITGGRRTVGVGGSRIAVLGRQADRTVDSQACALCQGQGAVGRHGCENVRAGGLGRGGIHGIGFVKGDQQGDTCGDGILAGQGHIGQGDNDLADRGSGCGSGCIAQVVKDVGFTYSVVGTAAHTKKAVLPGCLRSSTDCKVVGICTYKNCFHTHIFSRNKGKAGCRR